MSLTMTGAVHPTLACCPWLPETRQARTGAVSYVLCRPCYDEVLCWRTSEPGTECWVAVCRDWGSNRMHMHTLGTLSPPG